MLKKIDQIGFNCLYQFRTAYIYIYPLLCAVKTPSDKVIRVMSSASHQNT